MRTYFKSIRNLFMRFRQAFANEKVFLVICTFLLILLLFSTAFYVLIEKFSFVDALYYSVMIMTNVGSSDFNPKTAAGKLFTSGFAVVGVSLFVGLITGLAQAIIIQEYNKEK